MVYLMQYFNFLTCFIRSCLFSFYVISSMYHTQHLNSPCIHSICNTCITQEMMWTSLTVHTSSLIDMTLPLCCDCLPGCILMISGGCNEVTICYWRRGGGFSFRINQNPKYYFQCNTKPKLLFSIL